MAQQSQGLSFGGGGAIPADQLPDQQLMAVLALLASVGTQAGSYGDQAPSAANFLQSQLSGTTDKGVPNWMATAYSNLPQPSSKYGKSDLMTPGMISPATTMYRYDPGTHQSVAYQQPAEYAPLNFTQLLTNYGNAFKTYMNKNASQQTPPKTLFQQATGATINQAPVTGPMPAAAAPAVTAAPAITPNTAATNAALAPVPPALPANNPWSYGGPPTGTGVTAVPALASAPRAMPATVGAFMNTPSTGATGPTQNLGTYGGGGLMGNMTHPQQQALMGGISGIGQGLSQMLTPVPHQIPNFPAMPALPSFITPTIGQNMYG